MKLLLAFVVMTVCICGAVNDIPAAVQDTYDLPEPYLTWEKSYLKEFPLLQSLLNDMIATTVGQLKSPEADILHNRVCAALAYKMAEKMKKDELRLAIATDILHNISKEDKAAVLTNPDMFQKISMMVNRLKGAGYFKSSPKFWSDQAILKNPRVGGNLALIHHLTGALMAGEIVAETGCFSEKEIDILQVAILEHSTGYWYFRNSVDDAVGQKGAWQTVYPEPENEIAKIAHDADLISQFVPESVVPEGSKWRDLAKKRWKAKDAKEEAQIVYYVFFRLFEEAKTSKGKELAKEKWEQIKPELIRLMGLNAGDDPVAVLGVPKVFQRD